MIFALRSCAARLAACCACLGLAVVPPGARAATLQEDFSVDPSLRGWAAHGDTSLFSWDATAGRLAVTWDSHRPNAFFVHPLGTVLARADDFRFRFTLTLDEIRTGPSDGTFELAVGLIRQADAFRTDFFRGAGIHPAWGPRNLVEFDHFPASRAITPTVSLVAVGTNNLRWATLDLHPFELDPGPGFEIEVAHGAADGVLTLSVLRDGEPYARGSTRIGPAFGDFRVDTISITSYSGDHQPAGYAGDLLARGFIDDLEVEFPDPPRVAVHLALEPGVVRVSATVPAGGWQPVLERSTDLLSWAAVPAGSGQDGTTWALTDPDPPAGGAAYRVRLERP